MDDPWYETQLRLIQEDYDDARERIRRRSKVLGILIVACFIASFASMLISVAMRAAAPRQQIIVPDVPAKPPVLERSVPVVALQAGGAR